MNQMNQMKNKERINKKNYGNNDSCFGTSFYSTSHNHDVNI